MWFFIVVQGVLPLSEDRNKSGGCPCSFLMQVLRVTIWLFFFLSDISHDSHDRWRRTSYTVVGEPIERYRDCGAIVPLLGNLLKDAMGWYEMVQ